MGFNLTEITNQQVPTQEQSSYNFVYNPIKSSEAVISTGSVTKQPSTVTGTYVYNTTLGQTIKYGFRGRRIGVVVNRASNFGKLTFEIDGVAYPTFDTSNPDSFNNVPHIVATDLDDSFHVLTITKLDTSPTTICGFLVDDASNAQTFSRSVNDYHTALNGQSTAINIGTSNTTVSLVDYWVLNAIITNTTASPINVTLKTFSGNTIVGPFPVAANDCRTIQGPIFFSGGMSVIASATGCFIVTGGQ